MDKENKLTRAQVSKIRQLIRRGDRITKIARIVGVPVPAVEKELELCVDREMGW